MTMPHLMNCPHSHDSWCLDCVKEQWEQLAAVTKERDELRKAVQWLYCRGYLELPPPRTPGCREDCTGCKARETIEPLLTAAALQGDGT